MQIVTTDEQRADIWQRAQDDDLQVDRTVDSNGDEFTIFSSWDDVEKLAEIVYTVLPQQVIDDYAPSWEHLEESRRPNPYHHIEWAIGDFGFDDEYTTCSQCYAAIHTGDYWPTWGYNYDLGEIYCADCLRTNAGDSAIVYLEYCAAHLEDDGEILRSIVNPTEFGYILLNPYSAYGEYNYNDFLKKYEGIDNFPLEDCPSYPNGLLYAAPDELKKIGKSARLIDENLSIVAQYGPYEYSKVLLWAKFDEPLNDDGAINLLILQYAIDRVFAKYANLRK